MKKLKKAKKKEGNGRLLRKWVKEDIHQKTEKINRTNKIVKRKIQLSRQNRGRKEGRKEGKKDGKRMNENSKRDEIKCETKNKKNK